MLPRITASAPSEIAASTGVAFSTRERLLLYENEIALMFERAQKLTEEAAQILEMLERRTPGERSGEVQGASPPNDAQAHVGETFERDMQRCESKSPTPSDVGSGLAAESLTSTSVTRQALQDASHVPQTAHDPVAPIPDTAISQPPEAGGPH
ncbi:hypothetical protein PCA31118_01105 [Pandoraea captiosa]|uniref:Uncharacterized protein n=1 Tax=Pandoraea captiosa TaxID=2508302 RepID=A0A5E4ZS82_9BURK|nr:hypothetical protein [Pandoraea captiosa]VVE63143.1 hypothetical protein PCA31118_01105 [Pandoraea captiosa]